MYIIGFRFFLDDYLSPSEGDENRHSLRMYNFRCFDDYLSPSEGDENQTTKQKEETAKSGDDYLSPSEGDENIIKCKIIAQHFIVYDDYLSPSEGDENYSYSIRLLERNMKNPTF